MILEPLRMITDWLSGAAKDLAAQDQGVNVQLDRLLSQSLFYAVDDDATHSAFTHVTGVYDSSRLDALAAGDVPIDLPVVVVTQAAPMEAEGEVRTGPSGVRDGAMFPVDVRYVRGDWNTAKAETATLYALRAIVRSLRLYMALDPDLAQRKQNGIGLMACHRLRWSPAYQKVGLAFVTGLVYGEWKVRDTVP